MQSSGNGSDVGRCPRNRSAGGEQTELLHEAAAPIVEDLRAERAGTGGHPDVIGVRIWWQRRQHANDRVHLVIHREGCANDFRIAA